MIRKPVMTIALASVITVGLVATSVVFATTESGDIMSEKKSDIPRYSETCAHGHNGFDCTPPSYRTDISDLQERVTALEKRVSRP